ncbi:unnamed protein product [Bursaphelenchus okinawaensis]|uniref:Uncharacterized protein n=1 Tax=Bursaphelenchus okinawaensis TaxID=465554 RepID=A0A811JVV5_9BILA|nr:unnamed protein product [Bursaphelenchus okinawaensis]CAG9085667.1 unnamed protein product [Bursaphelenchus okinawaensis]
MPNTKPGPSSNILQDVRVPRAETYHFNENQCASGGKQMMIVDKSRKTVINYHVTINFNARDDTLIRTLSYNGIYLRTMPIKVKRLPRYQKRFSLVYRDVCAQIRRNMRPKIRSE